MAKANFKDNKSLQDAKNKTRNAISCRKMKDGRAVAARWSIGRKRNK